MALLRHGQLAGTDAASPAPGASPRALGPSGGILRVVNTRTRAEVRRVLVAVGTGGTAVDAGEELLVAAVDAELDAHRASVRTRVARLLAESGHGDAAELVLADKV